MVMKEKTKEKEMSKENFQLKDYVKSKCIEDVRTQFRIRSGMIDCKMNYMNKTEYITSMWRCDSCMTTIESQSHVLHCPAYRKLREDKDLSNNRDIVDYFRSVLSIRSKLNITK